MREEFCDTPATLDRQAPGHPDVSRSVSCDAHRIRHMNLKTNRQVVARPDLSYATSRAPRNVLWYA